MNFSNENRVRLAEIDREYERAEQREMENIREAKQRLRHAKERRNREIKMIEATLNLRHKGPKITIKNQADLFQLQ